MSRKRKSLIAVLVLAAILIAAVLLNFHQIRLLAVNLFPEKVDLVKTDIWTGGTEYTDIPYSKESERNRLSLFVPESDKKRSLIILIHGGDFINGDLNGIEEEYMYTFFREKGYAVASIDYRAADEAEFPTAIEDCKAAIRYLRANAQEYGLNANKFALWGESTGAYLALMCAVTTDEEFSGVPFIGEEELEEPVSARVSTLIDFYGPVHYEDIHRQYQDQHVMEITLNYINRQGQNFLKEQGYQSIMEYWMGKRMQELTEEEKNQIDPYYYISKNLNEESPLQVLIWHGDADLQIPFMQSKELADYLAENIGSDKVTYRLFHNYGHRAQVFYSNDNLQEIHNYLKENFNRLENLQEKE